MSSDLLIINPSRPFFSLTHEEYAQTLKKYPDLIDHCDINYEKNSASATITIGGDNYFDNQTILSQFKRLFQLLLSKEECKGHHFVCFVDNARTHTVVEFSLNDFGIKPETRCPVDNID